MKNLVYLLIFFSILTYSQEVDVYHCTFEEEELIIESVDIDSNITPTTVTGGTNTIVTITGIGFGNVKGRLLWSTYAQSAGWQILSWTDTEIIAIVPPHARSGNVYIMQQDQTIIGTTNPIIVRYGIYNRAGVAKELAKFLGVNTPYMVKIINSGFKPKRYKKWKQRFPNINDKLPKEWKVLMNKYGFKI